MALYVSGRKSAPSSREWNTLDELRDFAKMRGCAPAQFEYAIEVMGEEPHHVANYLQRRMFMDEMYAETREGATA
jgi:hypothetical protein